MNFMLMVFDMFNLVKNVWKHEEKGGVGMRSQKCYINPSAQEAVDSTGHHQPKTIGFSVGREVRSGEMVYMVRSTRGQVM